MEQRLASPLQKDLPRRAFGALALLVLALRLLLTRFQQFYIWVGGAPLDDELLFRAAQSISAGEWLGAYDYLTLSKQAFFSLWLALVHALGLPYLAAGALLWCAAAFALAQALAPLLPRRWARLALFALLAFCPSSSAAYTLRVYRDNIFPSLVLLAVAGLVGWALRAFGEKGPRIGWLLVSGLALGAAILSREDGLAFLAPFFGAGLLALLAALPLGLGPRAGLGRAAALLLPVALAGGCLFGWGAQNRAAYGVFALSDFSSGPFAAAMGAMYRVKEEEPLPKVGVPAEVRELLYEAVPELRPLRRWLEEDPQFQNDFVNPAVGDYQTGSFYWALRRAAQYEGVYATAAGAGQYWQTVAETINALCDEGTLPSEGGVRVGTTPPISLHLAGPVLAETGRELWQALTFQGLRPYEAQRSIGTPEDIALWQGYLHEQGNFAAEAGRDTPYYSPLQRFVFRALEALRLAYALALPPAFLAAVLLWGRALSALLRRRSREGAFLGLAAAVVAGLLALALLRAAMVSFVMVSSFAISSPAMYLAPVYPLLVAFTAGALGLWATVKGKKP